MKEWPANLSAAAQTDLLKIVDASYERFGAEMTKASQDRLLARCLSIQKRRTIGHAIAAIETDRPLLYHYESPWLVAFDPETREVIGIIHGKRDLKAVIGKRSQPSGSRARSRRPGDP